LKRVIGLALGLGLAGVAALWLWPRASSFPRDERGWSDRWTSAAAEVGRTAGQGWEAWVRAADAVASLLTDPPPDLDASLRRLDWPPTVTPPTPDTQAPGPADWAPIARSLAHRIDASDDPVAVLDTAETARRIERGIGLARALPGASERFAFAAVIDPALRRAISSGRFTTDQTPEQIQEHLERLLALGVDDAGFDAEWFLREQRESALRAGVEAGRSRDDLRFIEQLFFELDQARRGRDPLARRSEAMLETLRRGQRPGVVGLIGDLDAFTSARRAARAERVGLLVMVALERHRLRTGQYPASLDALAPTELLRIPVDPFGFGERFGYERIDPQGPTPAAAYRLWSVGPDRQPHGGDPALDLVFNPAPQEPTP
jgi:hypothetical protein